ncbi:MAG: ribosomal-processing cysteine protease Prp [Thermoflexaceae bacterium]|nr:ribosomal-processing cysteine protease Prp [Thermoflexaceae bacterium]
MIRVTIYKKNDEIVGFKSEGHAGYDSSGKDIICAAVSTLVINTINSIELLTDDKDKYEVNEDENNALIEFRLTTDKPSRETCVLLKALELGLSGVRLGNKKFLRILFEEV